MFTYQLTQLLINNQIPVSSRVSTQKNVLITGNFEVFPLTTDQKVKGSSPFGCTNPTATGLGFSQGDSFGGIPTGVLHLLHK